MGSIPEVRGRLVAALEAAFYSGDTAGQMWLHDLSAYIQALPDHDSRLTALAATRQPAPIQEFLEVEARRVISSLNPSAWLDHYTSWATSNPR